MIQFPDYTCLPTPHVLYRPHKKGNRDFFDNLILSKQEKQELREQIQLIQITHQIDSQTTNIPEGKTVKQIMVLEIHLHQYQLATSLLEKLDERLGLYTAFVLKFPMDKEELLIHYKEVLAQEKDGRHFKIVRRFRTQEDCQIQFDGNDLDQVYEKLIKETGKDQLQSKLGGNLKESVELTEQLEKLEKQAQRLKRQMYAEKSMRKQMEVKKDYQAVLKQIQELK
ncbi:MULTISPECIES: DUF4391 domain-containing protein [Streptococcus]|jgi:hypothetical protein|uniref:DUF4391 domain-containing protein n=1 Tax=Streptococcus oralis TaxID=1303 RepID=A0A6N3B788_STROR|nr:MULTISPECIES: DUF4391 domain-containing protein [Streptococcus]MDB8650725.1 DUF4391 domain-containing protein [Streptococcus australis]RSK00899.1 hypothetical protein D8783_06970 [Streptococcus sp. A12]